MKKIRKNRVALDKEDRGLKIGSRVRIETAWKGIKLPAWRGTIEKLEEGLLYIREGKSSYLRPAYPSEVTRIYKAKKCPKSRL